MMPPTKKQQEVHKAKKTSALAWAQQQDKGFEPTCIKLPPGVELFDPDPGVYSIDIIPYRVGKVNPLLPRNAQIGMEEGDLHFELEYACHRLVAANGRTDKYVCLGCWRVACPVCQRYNRPRPGDEPDDLKNWKPSTRHLWNVINLDSKDKKVQVYDSNHWNRGMGFGEQVCTAILSVPEYQDFADLENGHTLRITVREQTWPGGKYNAVTRIDFVKRKHSYDESVLDQAVCLDDCLVRKTPQEIKDILDQAPPAEEDSPQAAPRAEAPRSTAVRVEKEVPAESNGAEAFHAGRIVDHKKYGRCSVVRYSKDEQAVSLKVAASGLVKNGCDPDDCTFVDPQEAPEARPAARPAKVKAAPAPAAKAEEDEDVDLFADDDDD
jgi:hypothetical protein